MSETTNAPQIVVLCDGIPNSLLHGLLVSFLRLGSRSQQMVRAIAEENDEIEAEKSGCLELHYGPHEVQARIEKKLGFWKVG